MPETIEQEQLNVDDLLDVIRRSGLTPVDTLAATLQSLDLESATSDDVLALLKSNELITAWQAQQLQKRRWKNFFMGKYRLLGELGRGGMATVYLALHETLHSYVAIKVLSRSRMQKSSTTDRFLREAQVAARISHPNIVRVFDVDVASNRQYLVMEYVDGWSLQDLVHKEGVLPCRKAVKFTRQVAHGLAHAHDSGLIHRDIKPANLLLDKEGVVKISDFGLARVEASDEDGSLTMEHGETVLGTADYIAPEQAVNSHRINAKADQYCLGQTLYFMLTGQPPFPTGPIVERLTKHCTAEPESVSSFREDVPEDLLAILHRLTRKKPHERFPSMNEVADALSQWLTQHPVDGDGGLLPKANASPEPERARPNASGHDEELLTLAPETDERPSRKQKAHAPTETGENLPAVELDTLPDESMFDAGNDTSVECGNDVVSDLLDELLDEDALESAPITTSSPAGVRSFGIDAPGSDVLRTSLATGATHASPSGESAPTQRKESFFTGVLEGMKRGDYPLWILIGAGLIFGAILLFIAFSYATSFEPIDVPDRIGEG